MTSPQVVQRNYNSKIYRDKVQHLATVLSQMGTDINPDGPAIIGVAEIEMIRC